MAKTKKTTAAVAEATPRKSSRISEAKRKATDEVSPASTKKIKAVVADKVAAVAPEEPVKQKKTKKAKTAAAAAPPATPAKSKKSKKAAAAEEDKESDKENDKAEDEEAQEAREEVAEEDDETTKALVKEIDADEDEDKEPSGGASLFQPGQDVGKAPAAAVKKAAQIKSSKKSSKSSAVTTTPAPTQNGETAAQDQQQYGGIVYVGRIPHGFFEHEMRSYFSQFGDIRRLRLSRNRKTGASKHYAFIEFSDRDVAEIVAKTMDNYLLFGHILRCSIVASERIPPNLFKGANRRFKAVPWNLMSGRRMAQPKPESDWSGKISREAKRRASRAAQLEKKLGYSFDGPALKSVDTIEAPVSAIEDSKAGEKLVEAAAPAAIEPAAEAEAVPVAAKGKKAKGKKVKA